MNINFDPRWLGLVTAILIVMKLAVPGFVLPWVWVLSPLWIVAGFICLLGLLGALFRK